MAGSGGDEAALRLHLELPDEFSYRMFDSYAEPSVPDRIVLTGHCFLRLVEKSCSAAERCARLKFYLKKQKESINGL